MKRGIVSILIFIVCMALSSCVSKTNWAIQSQEQQMQRQNTLLQKRAEFERAFTQQEKQRIEATIRQGLQYPASASFDSWAVISAEDRQGWVVVDALNTFGTRRTMRGYIFQINADGSIISEPYARR